jgi:hypothetical protein
VRPHASLEDDLEFCPYCLQKVVKETGALAMPLFCSSILNQEIFSLGLKKDNVCLAVTKSNNLLPRLKEDFSLLSTNNKSNYLDSCSCNI